MPPMISRVRRNLPNGLTLFRLILAAAFFGVLNPYRHPGENQMWAYIAIGLFILAVVTDALDGYLARRWEVVSVFGRIMDPFCDKVLIIGAFIYLAGPRFVVPAWVEQGSFFTMATGVYPWMVVVILARELLVTGIRGEVESLGGAFGSTWTGKWKMILQSICVPVVLFLVVTFDPGVDRNRWSYWTCSAFVYLTVLVTAWSGVPYVVMAPAAMRRRANGEAES